MDNSSLVGISKYIDYDPYGMLLGGQELECEL
jgi:hypothetical protein